MTEIEVYQPPKAEVVLASDIDSWTQVATHVIRLAKEIADTPFVPDGLRGSVPATAAAILSGRELGLGPMTSLANIHVIKGKPALSAALMRALILAQGHQIETVDITDTRAVVRGRRKGEATWEEAAFTADQAKRAGIVLGGYPQDKLYARATSRLARRKFADVIAGMPYAAEELEDGIDGEVPADAGASAPSSNGAAASVDKPRTAQRKTRTQDASPVHAASVPLAAPAQTSAPQGAGEALPPLPGEDEPPGPAGERSEPATAAAAGPDTRHAKLVGIVQGHLKRLGFTVDDDDREERLPLVARLAGISFDQAQVFSTNDFDADDLSTVADTLSRCRDRKALDALLKAAKEARDGE